MMLEMLDELCQGESVDVPGSKFKPVILTFAA